MNEQNLMNGQNPMNGQNGTQVDINIVMSVYAERMNKATQESILQAAYIKQLEREVSTLKVTVNEQQNQLNQLQAAPMPEEKPKK